MPAFSAYQSLYFDTAVTAAEEIVQFDAEGHFGLGLLCRKRSSCKEQQEREQGHPDSRFHDLCL